MNVYTKNKRKQRVAVTTVIVASATLALTFYLINQYFKYQ